MLLHYTVVLQVYLQSLYGVHADCSVCVLQAINNEEELLEWELTPFPQIQTISQLKEPYERLWLTSVNFHEKYDKWMNGQHFYMYIVYVLVHE